MTRRLESPTVSDRLPSDARIRQTIVSLGDDCEFTVGLHVLVIDSPKTLMSWRLRWTVSIAPLVQALAPSLLREDETHVCTDLSAPRRRTSARRSSGCNNSLGSSEVEEAL